LRRYVLVEDPPLMVREPDESREAERREGIDSCVVFPQSYAVEEYEYDVDVRFVHGRSSDAFLAVRGIGQKRKNVVDVDVLPGQTVHEHRDVVNVRIKNDPVAEFRKIRKEVRYFDGLIVGSRNDEPRVH